MPDKMHLEGVLKIGPALAESEERSFNQSQHVLGFPKPRLVPVTQGPVALFRKPRFLLRSTVTDNRLLLLPILLPTAFSQ